MMINTDSKKELQMMVAEQKNRRNLGRYFTSTTNMSSSTDRHYIPHLDAQGKAVNDCF